MSNEKIRVHICGSGGWGIGSYKMRFEDGTEDTGYGFFRPENPHDFFPDAESCTTAEIENHRAAREEWDKAYATRARAEE